MGPTKVIKWYVHDPLYQIVRLNVCSISISLTDSNSAPQMSLDKEFHHCTLFSQSAPLLRKTGLASLQSAREEWSCKPWL